MLLRQLFLTLLCAFSLFANEFDWLTDYKAALKEAKEQKKNIYMLITSENCRWCKKLEATTLQSESVLAKLKKSYVLLHINRDRDYIPSRYTVKGVPRHYFITPGEEEIYQFLGYWNEEDFLSYVDDANKEYRQKFKYKTKE